MDRFAPVLVVAGLLCFIFSVLVSALYPWWITGATVPEASIEEVAQEVTAEFQDLKDRFPIAFEQFYADSEDALTLQQLASIPDDDPRRDVSASAWRRTHAYALREGRDVYIAEGCWHCHSQYVRPVSNEDVRFGPVSTWAQDNNALQRPVLWGTRRVGPDLTYEGGLRSNDWHTAHFANPQATSPGSVMPAYRWFLRDGYQVYRRIAPDLAERTGLSEDTSYPIPGIYDTQAEAESALVRVAADLPSSLAAEADRLFVAEGSGLGERGLSVVAYLQWLGTWKPVGPEAN